MCINEETSIITLVLGTVINLSILIKLYPEIFVNNYSMNTFFVVILWQYALLMQIPDYIAWNSINSNKNTEFAGKLAAFLNLTQPIMCFILMLILIHITHKDYITLLPGVIILIFYIINILTNFSKFKYDVSPSINCSGLNYKWWEHINPIFYLLCIPLLIISLKSLKLTILNIIIFFGSLLSSILLTYGCSPGSFWCWSVASAGLINYIFTLI